MLPTKQRWLCLSLHLSPHPSLLPLPLQLRRQSQRLPLPMHQQPLRLQ